MNRDPIIETKRHSKQDDAPKCLKLTADIKELEIADLNIPRLIRVWGFNSQGQQLEWVLKITKKETLILL